MSRKNNMLRLLTTAFVTLMPTLVRSQPAIQLVPTDSVPIPLNLRQVFPSGCSINEPSSGALMKYWSRDVGTYTAYGDKSLLPFGVIATHEGYPGKPGDRLTFGSRTRIIMPKGNILLGQPYPAVPLIIDTALLVNVVIEDSNSENLRDDTFTYTFPVITEFWEIAGPRNPGELQKRVCLYLKAAPH